MREGASWATFECNAFHFWQVWSCSPNCLLCVYNLSPVKQSNPPGMYMFPKPLQCKSSGCETLCQRQAVTDRFQPIFPRILYIFAPCFFFFLQDMHFFFLLHGQHPIAFVAHLYTFKCWRRSSSNLTHAGSRASLCERLCRSVEIWLAVSPQLSRERVCTLRIVTGRLLPGEDLQFVFLTWL